MLTVTPSARLTYRRVTAQDRDFLFEIDQDEEVMRYLTGGRKTTRKEVDEVFIPRIESFNNEEKGWGLWQVSLSTGNRQAIGWILVRPLGFFTGNPQPDNLELGWRFRRQSWGKGYATEAAHAALKYGFELAHLPKIVSSTTPLNKRSVRVMEKIGMHHDCNNDFDHPKLAADDSRLGHILYHITREQYQEQLAS